MDDRLPRGYRSTGSIYCAGSRGIDGRPYYRGTIDIGGALVWVCPCPGGHTNGGFATLCAEARASKD